MPPAFFFRMIRESSSTASGTNSALGPSDGLADAFGVPASVERADPPFSTKTTEAIFAATRNAFYDIIASLLSHNELSRLHEEVASAIGAARRDVVRSVYKGLGGIEGYARADQTAIDAAVADVVPTAVRAFLRTHDREAA